MTAAGQKSPEAPRTPSVRRLLLVARTLGLAALGLAALTILTPLPNVAARRLVRVDAPAPADAIVALSSTINGDGTLSDNSMSRFIRATELYAEGLAPLLVLSGTSPEPGLEEGEVRAALARRFGVPESAIITVSGHHTTYEEALSVVAAPRPRGARRVLVVTDWAHIGRVRAVYKRAGLEVRVVATHWPVDTTTTPQGRLWLAWDCTRELLARVYYRFAGFA